MTDDKRLTARAVTLLLAEMWDRFTKRELKVVLRYLNDRARLVFVLKSIDTDAEHTGGFLHPGAAPEAFAWFAGLDEATRDGTVRRIKERLATRQRSAS